jgi:heterodisulfide reductase subunit C
MDYKPAQVLRLLQLGLKDEVLKSNAIWYCVGCETCGTRCPNEIRLAPMFDTLRYMALEQGYKPEPVVHAFHRSFLNSIKLWGRVHELSMIAQYKLRAPFGSDLRADIKVALYLFLKGKIFSLPERVRGLAQVRGFFAGSKSHSETEVGQ